MLRVEKQLTDSSLVQGQNKAQGQGLSLGNKAQNSNQAQLFQSELLSVLGGNQEQEANLELLTAQNQASPEQILAQREAALKLVANTEVSLPKVEAEFATVIKPSGEEQLTGEEVAAEQSALAKNIKSEIKVLEKLLTDNPDKVNVKVVEAESTNTKKSNIGKMGSPWNMESILEGGKSMVGEESSIKSLKNKENLSVQREINELDNKVLTNANNKIKQTKSLQKFNTFKQENPFKSALMNEAIDLKKSGPTVFERDQKFENPQDVQRSNIMNLGSHASAMNATHKLATNMTFKVAPEAEVHKVNDVSQQIIDYIRQNAKVDNGNVEVQFNHEALGDIILKVNEAEKGIVNINLQSLQKQGVEFFKANQSEIIDALAKTGIKVADFNVSQASSNEGNNSWSFEGNSQGQQHQQKNQQQEQDTERRKQLWQQYQNQEAA